MQPIDKLKEMIETQVEREWILRPVTDTSKVEMVEKKSLAHITMEMKDIANIVIEYLEQTVLSNNLLE
jgi:hypothetical protein